MLEKLKLKVPPLLITFLWGLLMWCVPGFFSSLSFQLSYSKPISYAAFFIGTAIIFVAVFKFRKKGTTVDPINPEKTKELVASGIYKYSRNPMYLGFFLWLLALGLYLGNFINALLLLSFVIYMNFFQIKPEEKVLKKAFGKRYEEYMRNTRRWI